MKKKAETVEERAAPTPEEPEQKTCERIFIVNPREICSIVSGNDVLHIGKGVLEIHIKCREDDRT